MQEAVRIAVEALRDASEEDIATGGPDPVRGIFPTVKAITSQGVEDVSGEDVKRAFDELVAESGTARG